MDKLLFILEMFVIHALHYTTVMSKRRFGRSFEFAAFVNSQDFVDKSLFIKTVFDAPEKIMIMAPPRSGKSTNLHMIKKFLEIEVDDYGEPLTKSNKFKKVNDTSNYRIFNVHALKITRHYDIMKRHFGKYPIIFVDFKCKENKITTSENAVYCFIESIHAAFFQHRYLRKSEVLNTKERRLVKRWCDIYVAYDKFFGQDVTNSLYKLAFLLYKHFGGREVVVLIDNYDFPSASAVYEVKDGMEQNRVVKFNMGIISKLLSADYRYLARAVVSGVSYLAAAGIYQLDEVQLYQFLWDHPFNQYFGLTRHEVDSLTQRALVNDSITLSLARQAYGGLVSNEGKVLYNLNSVLAFMHAGEVRDFCPIPKIVKHLDRLFKILEVREQVEMLVKGGTITMNTSEVITINDMINLRDALLNVKQQEHFNTNLAMYSLLEQGYLSFVYQKRAERSPDKQPEFKLPNGETKKLFALKLKDYYERIYMVDRTQIKKCANFFGSFSPLLIANRNSFKRALYWFFKSFDDLISFTKKRFRKLNAETIARLLFSTIYQLNIKGSNSFAVKVTGANGELNVNLFKDGFHFLLSLKPNHTSNSVLKTLLSLNKTELSVHPYPTKGRIFIGMGLDELLRPSISCLLNSRNESQAEHIPDFR